MNRHKEVTLIIVLLLSITMMGTTYAETFKTGIYPGNSFIEPTALINVGNFAIGSESYVAPFASFTGDYVYIGDHSDVQDSVTGSGKIKIENNAVVAHGSHLTGNVTIGIHAFAGFNSLIKDSKIGDGAYIGIGSKVIGVDIPASKSVPPGKVIDNKEAVDGLPQVTEDQEIFVDEVIEVNRALATGYVQLFQRDGPGVFTDVGPNGDGDILIDGKDILARKGSNNPVIGDEVELSEQQPARIIGCVYIGKNSIINSRTSIRGDEGIPIMIGDNAQIGKGNTFHSLNNDEIKIGSDFKLGDGSIIHGPLVIGNNVTVGNRAVVYKSDIGSNAIIGDNAIVTGVTLFSDVIIPHDSIVTAQKDARIFNDDVQSAFQSKPQTSWHEMASIVIVVLGIGLSASYMLRNKKN